MISYAVYDPDTEEIERSGECLPAAFDNQGEHVAEVAPGQNDATGRIVAGAFVPYTAEQIAAKAHRPRYKAVWSNAAMAWVDLRTLSDLQSAKRAEINNARAQADRGAFMFVGHRIQADDVSKARIYAVAITVATTGDFPADFPHLWKDTDNGYVAIPDLTTWQAFYNAMVAQGTANFATSETLKAALAAATTKEQIEAIVWPPPTA